MMDKFNYGIKSGDTLIAAFLVEYDRDCCMDTLTEKFDDAEFNAVEIE